MRPLHSLILALLASAACSAESVDTSSGPFAPETSPGVHVAVNPAASFGVYRTFSFGPAEVPPPGYRLTPRSEETERRLPPLITAALLRKGYLPEPVTGDLVVVFGAGRRDTPVHGVSSISGSGWLPDDMNADIREGSIVVDVFDTARGLWVWHGTSRAAVSPENVDAASLRHSVDALLAEFPPAGGEGAPRASR
ncbi:MAG TPA: DUF4136 domain-containing protein [Polyangiaceae bacterium]|jgi:hypothetical protein